MLLRLIMSVVPFPCSELVGRYFAARPGRRAHRLSTGRVPRGLPFPCLRLSFSNVRTKRERSEKPLKGSEREGFQLLWTDFVLSSFEEEPSFRQDTSPGHHFLPTCCSSLTEPFGGSLCDLLAIPIPVLMIHITLTEKECKRERE
jgi:hypothetical protein